MRKLSYLIAALLVAVSIAGAFGLQDSLLAQGKSKPKGKPNVNIKEVDAQAERNLDSFIRAQAELAKSYENAEELEKAKAMLASILKVKPDQPGVASKIKELEDTILTANEVSMDLDVSKGWGKGVAEVKKDKPFKINVDGDYRFITNSTVGPNGFPTDNPTKGMAPNVKCGQVMGLFFNGKKPGRPFPIGASKVITPKEDGILFLSVNVPPGSRCVGKLKVEMSGYVKERR